MSENMKQTNESLLGRFLHNLKLKTFFKETFIKSWVDGSGENGVTKYNWEKTPTTPGNLNVAWNALSELQTYYNSVPADVKSLQQAQRSGFLGGLFAGFWTKVFQRMMGNPTKMETLAKFNASMKNLIPKLFNACDNFFKKIDEEKKKAHIGDDGGAPTPASAEESVNEADPPPGTDPAPETPPKEGNKVEEEAGALFEILYDVQGGLEKNEKAGDLLNQYKNWLNTGVFNSKDHFVEDCKKQIETSGFNEKQLATARSNAYNAIQSALDADIVAFAQKIVGAKPDTVKGLVELLVKKDDKGKKIAGNALSGINALIDVLSVVNDGTTTQISWENGGLGKLSNVYRAEDSLYKIIVFFGAWVDNFNKGIQYDRDGSRLKDLTTEDVMTLLKGPAGKLFQEFQKDLTSVNDTFSKTSGFGTLQESEMKQIREGLEQLNEKDFNMKQKKMKRTNEALAKLKACMEMDEPVNETAPQDLAPEPITTEDNKEEANAMADKLRKLADARKVREERVKKGKMKVIFGNEGKESANEALSRLSRFVEETEVKVEQPETQVVKEPNAEPKKEHLGIEVVFGEEVPSDRALKQLQNLVYDGEPPAVEVPVDEGAAPVQPEKKPEDEQDEIIQPESQPAVVTEAPGDPNDPNAADPNAAPADPNAAAADPNVPPAADPGAAMSVGDLGAPPDPAPVDPAADPTAAADPAAGADPAAAGAPSADPTADPNAAAAPADPNAPAPAPDETQQNVAGEAPNAAGTENGEPNKFDIGVTKPYNAEGEELHLTDQEQEQLFTKINLLTKIPDLVNYGKYFYNITPENVSLDDIHYINDLYELSVKLGLLTDDFEGNNLLEKYDSYKYSVISKQPEQALINADAEQQAAGAMPAQQVAEGVHKVKTESGIEVEIHDAPGLVIAKDVKDYMDKKDDANAEAHGEITFRGALDRVRGLGSLVTFTGVVFGCPVIKTLYVKRVGEKLAKKEAEEQLKKQGYADVEILAIENIDPIDYLYHQYEGMRTLEDEFTREYMKQRMEKRVARNLKKLNESVESKSIIPQEFDDDIGRIVDNLNKEIMEDPTIDFSKEVGLPKMMVTKEDFEKCYEECPITEDGDDDGNDCCQFCVTKNGANNLSRVLFSTNCQKLCKCLEGIAATYGMNLSAIAEGNNILEGVDKITLTFSR